MKISDLINLLESAKAGNGDQRIMDAQGRDVTIVYDDQDGDFILVPVRTKAHPDGRAGGS
jgi:hypothetical protein